MADYVNQMAEDDDLGLEQAENPEMIVIDYGGPNVAKPLHVGHLRSAVIGESVKRMFRKMGHKVLGDIHLGDWGYQMGLIITELKSANLSCRIMMSLIQEIIRKKHHLPSVSWKRSIRQPADMQKNMKITVKKRFMRPICFRMDIEDIVHSGIILLIFPLPILRRIIRD